MQATLLTAGAGRLRDAFRYLLPSLPEQALPPPQAASEPVESARSNTEPASNRPPESARNHRVVPRDGDRGPRPWRLPKQHARRLLEWIYEHLEPHQPCEILARDVVDCYHRMLLELEWDERPWSLVGNQLRQMLGDHKQYRWIRNDDGTKSRLCVYSLPARCPVERHVPLASAA